MMITAAIHPEKRRFERRTAARAEHRRSIRAGPRGGMSGCSAFTHGARLNIPFALNLSKPALSEVEGGERDFASLNGRF